MVKWVTWEYYNQKLVDFELYNWHSSSVTTEYFLAIQTNFISDINKVFGLVYSLNMLATFRTTKYSYFDSKKIKWKLIQPTIDTSFFAKIERSSNFKRKQLCCYLQNLYNVKTNNWIITNNIIWRFVSLNQIKHLLNRIINVILSNQSDHHKRKFTSITVHIIMCDSWTGRCPYIIVKLFIGHH